MDMAKIKLTQLSQHGELLDRYGAKIRILGQKSLLKEDVLEAMDRACRMTDHNTKTVLNVCFPYTSRDEIVTGIRETVKDWSKPIETKPSGIVVEKRGKFTEERIAQTLKTQHEHDERKSEEEIRHIEPKVDESDTESSCKKQKDEDNISITSSNSTSTLALHRESSESSPPTSYAGSPQSQPTTLSKQSKAAYPNPERITSETITSHLFTSDDPPLDLLIRTSGVERLSDFMLWQCHEDTRIVFLDVLWPEFDLWQFLPVMWEYQWRGRKDEQIKRMIEAS